MPDRSSSLVDSILSKGGVDLERQRLATSTAAGDVEPWLATLKPDERKMVEESGLDKNQLHELAKQQVLNAGTVSNANPDPQRHLYEHRWGLPRGVSTQHGSSHI